MVVLHLPYGIAARALLIAGNNGLAVDTVCAKIMGLDPLKGRHLKLAHGRELGVLDLREIEVRGVPLNEEVTKFDLPSKYKHLQL